MEKFTVCLLAVFAVTEDRNRPHPNRASPSRQWIVRSQARGEPDCEISCDVGQATLDSLQINVRMNTTGRVFFVLQSNSSALEPDVPSVCFLSSSRVLEIMRFRMLSFLIKSNYCWRLPA